jgi:hypothetical protein
MPSSLEPFFEPHNDKIPLSVWQLKYTTSSGVQTLVPALAQGDEKTTNN